MHDTPVYLGFPRMLWVPHDDTHGYIFSCSGVTGTGISLHREHATGRIVVQFDDELDGTLHMCHRQAAFCTRVDLDNMVTAMREKNCTEVEIGLAYNLVLESLNRIPRVVDPSHNCSHHCDEV